MKTFTQLFMALCLAVSALAVAPAYGKNIQRLKVPQRFAYSTDRTLPVRVKVILPEGKVAAVSFYSLDRKKKNSFLLQTGLTQPGGLYEGQLQVPAAVTDLRITARYEGWVQEKRVKVRGKRPIAATIRIPG